MKYIREAKRRLLANVGTNILNIGIGALVTLWLTRYLIAHLGLAVYGMVPLAVTLVAYSGLATLAISGTVSRFTSIHLNKEDSYGGSTYFSTAFFALCGLWSVLLVPFAAMALFSEKLFRIPSGYESEAHWLFIFVILSSFVTSLNSPFLVSTFVRHRFDLRNIVTVGSKLLQVGFIALCFTYATTSVMYVGMSYLVMALFALACSVLLARCLTPELQVRRQLFRWAALWEMARMGTWVTINQIGATLYLSTDILVINLFLGPEQVGRYAPIVQFAILLDLVSNAVAGVFSPIAYDYLARNETRELIRQTKRSTKFMALIMALPVGLLCGLSAPLLRWWLGPSFEVFSPLMWLLIAPRVITLTVKPLFAVNQGMNKVQLPSLVTVSGGVANVVLSILLVRNTNLGLYGVALATALCLTAKNLLFTPLYGAHILNCRKTTFFHELLTGLLLTLSVAAAGFAASMVYDLATAPRLVGVGLAVGAVYLLVSYWLAINKNDRHFLWSLVRRTQVVAQ